MLNSQNREGIVIPGEAQGAGLGKSMAMTRNVSSAGIAQTLTREQQADMTLASMLLDEFRNVRKDMPISHAYCFLMVAQEEGLTVSQYAERAGCGQTVMTRWLFDIGSHSRTREPGLGLVMQRSDPNDLRKHQTFLTQKGKELAFSVMKVLKLRRG